MDETAKIRVLGPIEKSEIRDSAENDTLETTITY